MTEIKNLISYLEQMISNGVKLVYGGMLFEWSETLIVDKIKKINRSFCMNLDAGTKLLHKISGQEMFVVSKNDTTIFLMPSEQLVKYPINKILNDFTVINNLEGQGCHQDANTHTTTY